MDFFKDELKFWHTIAKTLVLPSATHPGITSPSMIIELYLDTSKLNWWQILLVMDEMMQMNRVDLSRDGKSILLERWILTLE